jgi:hypothetical protein
MTNYILSNLGGWWFGLNTWVNASINGYGQPGLGDTAAIAMNGNPWIYNGILDGPSVFINDPNASPATGLSAYNSTVGVDTTIYVQSGIPTIKLSNSVINGNLFAQGGSITLSVPPQTYGDNLGTTIVGGIPASSDDYKSASLEVKDAGTFANFGNMCAFNSGTLTFSAEQQALQNDGLIVANAGTVSISGTLGNVGSLLAIDSGTISPSSMVLGGMASVYDKGAFILEGSITGAGVLDLNGGRIEFTDASHESIAQTVTVDFSGSSFSLQFDGATSVSDLLLSASSSGGHDDLVVAVSISTGIQLMVFCLDTAHSYADSEFTVQGNQIVYTSAISTI